MTINARNSETEQRIKKAYDQIINACPDELKAQINASELIITDDFIAPSIYNDPIIFQKAQETSFGAVKGSILYDGERTHLIVLNMTNIENFSFDESELAGILAHEMGHFFNDSPKHEMPSILKGNNLTEINEAKAEAAKQLEIYADYFSKITSTKTGLLSTINKYLATEDAVNRDMFIERIEALNSGVVYQGSIKPIEKY